MHTKTLLMLTLTPVLLLGFLVTALQAGEMPPLPMAGDTIEGTPLSPSAYGPGYIESMQTCIDRDRLTPPPANDKERAPGQPGLWVVPTVGASRTAHSGEHYIINKWGDLRMAIGFATPVSVQGVFVFGQSEAALWPPGLRVVGYCNGKISGQTEWFTRIGETPNWMPINLADVDRIEFHAVASLDGGAFYGLDDLSYTPSGVNDAVTLNFDDLTYHYQLTGTGYAGLAWERGQGEYDSLLGVHGPMVPPGYQRDVPAGAIENVASGTRGTEPNLLATYQGVIRGDAGSMSYPPDTDGAIGPRHYVETVNRNFAIYDNDTGQELVNILLGTFLPNSNGDPRTLFDHHSGRWFVHVTDFSATRTVFLAVSLTDDPTGDWFKTSFKADSGGWPDYPTLGVDQHGVYITAYMVGSGSMALYALDKAPLVAPNPSLGKVTVFSGFPFEGAVQPAHVYGVADGCYLVSASGGTTLRLRRVNPPLSNPTLTEVGLVTVPAYSDPPNAPAKGSSVPLNTVDDRLMMSVWRDGSLWTAHTITVDGRAGCRWYEIDTATRTLKQWGNITEPGMWYFFPSIMINNNGDAVMGFTGSNPDMYAACYYTGRTADDPLGEMAPPVMFKEGTGPQNNVDGYGRNRWGDYSYTTLDPVDENTFWTIQEYGHGNNIWGTYIAVLAVEPPDCNDNGIPDPCDIDCGPPGGDCDLPGCGQSTDCNGNGIPDECEGGQDCNNNGVPDFCDIIWQTSEDCNENGVPDECDIAAQTSKDCQPNGIPDECEVGTGWVQVEFPLDENPGWTTQGAWAFGQPTGQGGNNGSPDPTSGATGSNVYGYNLNGDYTNNMPEYHLTSTAIDCSRMTRVSLQFQQWLGVERSLYDHAYVRVSSDGSNWTTAWENPDEETANDKWIAREIDISAIADNQETVYLRWTMGTTDVGWTYCGWNIDDIVVRGYVYGGGPNDCNNNAIPDECDILGGFSTDLNGNQVPDECEGLGDLDCSGEANFADINPFVLRLTDPQGYAAQYPNCPDAHGDINGDGKVDFGDINPFVTLLTHNP